MDSQDKENVIIEMSDLMDQINELMNQYNNKAAQVDWHQRICVAAAKMNVENLHRFQSHYVHDYSMYPNEQRGMHDRQYNVPANFTGYIIYDKNRKIDNKFRTIAAIKFAADNWSDEDGDEYSLIYDFLNARSPLNIGEYVKENHSCPPLDIYGQEDSSCDGWFASQYC